MTQAYELIPTPSHLSHKRLVVQRYLTPKPSSKEAQKAPKSPEKHRILVAP